LSSFKAHWVRLGRQSHQRLDESNTYFAVSYFNKRYLYFFFYMGSNTLRLYTTRPLYATDPIRRTNLISCLSTRLPCILSRNSTPYSDSDSNPRIKEYIHTSTQFLSRGNNEVHRLNNPGPLTSGYNIQSQCSSLTPLMRCVEVHYIRKRCKDYDQA
jgi:hypothetical protein